MLAQQAYDIKVEHIKGIHNVVADGLSRLCPDERTPLGMTKSPKSLKETGSSKKSDEDKPDVMTNEKERVDGLDIFQRKLTKSLSLPR